MCVCVRVRVYVRVCVHVLTDLLRDNHSLVRAVQFAKFSGNTVS